MAAFSPVPVTSRNQPQPAPTRALFLPAPAVADPNLPQIALLERSLAMNQMRYEVLEGYYKGEHRREAFNSLQFQQAFGRQLHGFADNWMKLIIGTTNNRLRIQGFRVGDAPEVEQIKAAAAARAAASDEGEAVDAATELAAATTGVDKTGWRVWKANRLAQGSRMSHRDAMKFGTSFVLVDPTGANETTPPLITVESPLQVVGQRDSANRYRLVSAIKKWIGNDNYAYLNLYTPDVVYCYRAQASVQTYYINDPSRLMQTATWRQINEIANPLGVVPIVPIENEADTLLGGLSDLEDVIPLNDGLNKTLRDMLVASEYQAFRQRYVTGVEVPRDANGTPLNPQNAAMTATASHLWMFKGVDTKVGELGQVDLTPYLAAADMFVHHMSMVSSTPAYMLVGKIANLSADAIRAAELGFVGKLTGKQCDFGVGWEQVMGLAFLSMKLPDQPIETLWADANANSGSVLANELTLMGGLGVPYQILWEKWGATPQEILMWDAILHARQAMGLPPMINPQPASSDGNGSPQVKLQAPHSAPDD